MLAAQRSPEAALSDQSPNDSSVLNDTAGGEDANSAPNDAAELAVLAGVFVGERPNVRSDRS